MVRGQFRLGGEGKAPGEVLETGDGRINAGKFLLIKCITRQNGREQLTKLPELKGGYILAIGKLTGHQVWGEVFTVADEVAGAGACGRDGAGLK